MEIEELHGGVQMLVVYSIDCRIKITYSLLCPTSKVQRSYLEAVNKFRGLWIIGDFFIASFT